MGWRITNKADLYGLQESELTIVETMMAKPLPPYPPMDFRLWGRSLVEYAQRNQRNSFGRDMQAVSSPLSNPGERANEWGFTIEQLIQVEKITEDQFLYHIPDSYPFWPQKVTEQEYNEFISNPQLWNKYYNNVKQFIEEWDANGRETDASKLLNPHVMYKE